MRKSIQLLSILLIAAGILGINSCSKKEDYTCTTCVTAPEANATYDNNSGGIYKGTIIGSSGTIKFNVANDGSTVSAVMVLDGQTINLTSNVTWVNGQAFLGDFTGTMGGQPVSITFSVDISGANPTVTAANIPGHPNAVFEVYKETSNSQVVCFEGTFTGSSSGVFNMVLSTTLKGWKVVARENGKTSVSRFTGTLNGNAMTCSSCSQGSSITGTLNVDLVSGNWNDGQGKTGTWTGKKTM